MDLQKQLEDSNAEKLALDQLYVEALKNQLQLRKLLILKDEEITRLKNELEVLKKTPQEVAVEELVT